MSVEQMDIENPAVGFFPIILVLKKGICDDFCDAFAIRPPFPWEPRPTSPTLPKPLTVTLTPHSLQTHLYHHLVAVGSVNLTMDTFWLTLRYVYFLVGFWTEKPLDVDKFRWMIIYGWKKCQLLHPLITWPIYQRRCGYAYQQKKINGDRDGPCLFQIPYINIHLSIDRSIDW